MNQISKWHPNSQMDFGFFQRSELVWNIRAIIEGSCTVLVIRTAVPSRVWTTATLAFGFYQKLTIFLKEISYEYCNSIEYLFTFQYLFSMEVKYHWTIWTIIGSCSTILIVRTAIPTWMGTTSSWTFSFTWTTIFLGHHQIWS